MATNEYINQAADATRKDKMSKLATDPDRPKTLPLFSFLQMASQGQMRNATYTTKRNGFRINIQGPDQTMERTYFSKQGNKICVTKSPTNMMEAIVHHIETKKMVVSPSAILHGTSGRTAWELNAEFVAYSLADRTMADDLQALYHQKCINPATGKLDETNFGYDLYFFDAKFYDEGERQPQYSQRLQAIEESCFDMVPKPKISRVVELGGATDLIEDLLNQEGVVAHDATGNVHKIKMPPFVFKSKLIAVGNNLDVEGFVGYNRFVFGVKSERSGSWYVLFITDFKEVMTQYDRPKQGKAFVPPLSIKKDGTGRLACNGNFALRGLVDALHRAAGHAPKRMARTLFPRTATIRYGEGKPDTKIEIAENRNKETEFRPEDRFLDDPISVTIGGDLWLLKDGQGVHVQAPTILGVEGTLYGHKAYNEIETVSTLEQLAHMAETKPDRRRAYEMVGMKSGPFLGYEEAILKKMTPDAFTVEYFNKRPRVDKE